MPEGAELFFLTCHGLCAYPAGPIHSCLNVIGYPVKRLDADCADLRGIFAHDIEDLDLPLAHLADDLGNGQTRFVGELDAPSFIKFGDDLGHHLPQLPADALRTGTN